jgi:hypothetical protein
MQLAGLIKKSVIISKSVKQKGKGTDLLGCPLESGHHTVLDLVEVLHGLGAVHQQVGTSALRAEAPDLAGLSGVPLKLLHQVTTTLLQVLAGGDVTLSYRNCVLHACIHFSLLQKLQLDHKKRTKKKKEQKRKRIVY